MTEPNNTTTVGRPFDGDAARAAQAKAVESRKRNTELRKEREANPNGDAIMRIDANVQKLLDLITVMVTNDKRIHPNMSEML